MDLGAIEPVLGYALRRASVMDTQLFADTVGNTGLRPVQFTLLLLIRDNPGARHVDLSRVLGVRRANMVALIQELEVAGWIRREPHHQDRRAQSLHLSGPGLRMLKQVDQRHRVHLTELEKRLGKDDLEQLVGLLWRFVDPKQ
jgi:DNA-binding MarR family transcriptional regulator